jgi:hypothetical protein
MATSSASSSEAEEIFHIDHVDPVETVDAADIVDLSEPVIEQRGDGRASAAPVEAYVTVWRAEAAGDERDDAAPADESADRSTEYGTAAGMPARGVIVLSLLVCAVCAAADCALTGTLTMFFDLCFITICLMGAMAVRREDLFTAGVLAPLVFAAIVFVVAVGVADAFGAGGSISSAFFTGLAAHAGALVCGYGVALAVVGGRVAAGRG